jgi:hypothetical protein
MSRPIIEMVEETTINIVSISRMAVTTPLLRFLEEYKNYIDTDTELEEDLYLIHAAADDFDSMDGDIQKQMKAIGDQIHQLVAIADLYDAAYVRFIKS